MGRGEGCPLTGPSAADRLSDNPVVNKKLFLKKVKMFSKIRSKIIDILSIPCFKRHFRPFSPSLTYFRAM